MYRVVRYTREVTSSPRVKCSEKTEACDNKSILHVYFEDGGGVYACRECFDWRVNEGDWTTDSTETLKAS